MSNALYTKQANDRGSRCPVRRPPAPRWYADLPREFKDLVMTPVQFERHQEYGIRAERVIGRDVFDRLCFCDFNYVDTRLLSDDDEAFYEVPAYSESVTSWRLVDARWLVCRTTRDRSTQTGYQTRIYLSASLPN
jgi:hypothetical protein